MCCFCCWYCMPRTSVRLSAQRQRAQQYCESAGNAHCRMARGPRKFWSDCKEVQHSCSTPSWSISNWTSCNSNSSDIPHRRRRIYNSIIFARWHHCAYRTEWINSLSAIISIITQLGKLNTGVTLDIRRAVAFCTDCRRTFGGFGPSRPPVNTSSADPKTHHFC